jgi:hypothetical protein
MGILGERGLKILVLAVRFRPVPPLLDLEMCTYRIFVSVVFLVFSNSPTFAQTVTRFELIYRCRLDNILTTAQSISKNSHNRHTFIGRQM